MNWRISGTLVLLAVGIGACAQSPPDGPGVIEEQVSEAKLIDRAGCRKRATTGNRVKTWVCGDAKDDREMLSIITVDTD